ncbi:hypothetical protein ACHAPA_002423 [Fusarium lateritium]
MTDSPITGPGSIVCIVLLAIILLLRLIRFTINQVGSYKYHAVVLRQKPAVLYSNCSVILPITRPKDRSLGKCIRKILKNHPAHLYIVTIGTEAQQQVNARLERLRSDFALVTQISVGAVNKANKRRMIAHALSTIETPVTVVTDQGVHWPKGFLHSALAPFDDPAVSAVAVPKIVRKPVNSFHALWACLVSCYYGLLADENQAINALDSSVLFGGSTILFRTYHGADPKFRAEFENKASSYSREGVLHGGEHCFFNCYFLQEDGTVVFQDVPDTTVQVNLPTLCGFIREYIRTTHSTWRLSGSMFHHKSWKKFPWASYNTWLYSIFSYSLINDALIIALAYYNDSLSQATYFWIDVGAIVLFFQMGMALDVALRVRRRGGKYGFFTIFLCVLLSFPAEYVLAFLKIIAGLTCWLTEAHVRIPADSEQVVSESEEPAWIWGSTQMMGSPRESEFEPEAPNYTKFSVD